MRVARGFLAAALATLLLSLVAAPVSFAAPSDPFVRTGTINLVTPDGPYTAPPLGSQGLVFNRATGRILVIDEEHKSVVQFDQSGSLVNFSGIGSPKVELAGEGRLFIDNSGGPSQGNFYVLHPGSSVEGFGPDGNPLAGWPKVPTPGAGSLFSLAVDTKGHVWFAYENGNFSYLEGRNPDGTLTGKKIFNIGYYFAFDSKDNLIVSKPAAPGTGIYIAYAAQSYSKNSQLQERDPLQIVIDPSTDDVWMNHQGERNSLTGTRFSEPFVPRLPFEEMPGIVSNAFDFSADGQMLVVLEGSKVSFYKRQLPALPQLIGDPGYYEVKSQGVFITGEVDTGGGGLTTYRFEYSKADEYTPGTYTHTYPVPDYDVPHTNFVKENIKGFVNGLEALTTYHGRIALTNAAGTTYGPDTLIRTLAGTDSGTGTDCPNPLSRKQTGATGLPECRAYELVSAAFTGGYDVETSMLAGQEPFAGFPDAAGFPEGEADPKGLNKVLYGVHEGVIPGPWNPTNRGVDPYVATRNPDAKLWNTNYVGLEADSPPTKQAFSSQLGAADSRLGTFAFAGDELCFPCFATPPAFFETGIPLRGSDGALVQGLDETAPAAPSSARPEGSVATMLSADGNHLIFGSKYEFAAGGNDENGNLTIYDRNLSTGLTQVVSTDGAGDALEAGDEVAQLDSSDDGSQILIGTVEDEDAAGNQLFDLYMHRGTAANSVEIAPAATDGVLFDGMTRDGSKVFFTSGQSLDVDDTDSTADVYEAAIAADGSVDIDLLTPTSGAACNPVGNDEGAHWNSAGAVGCGAVAIGGGDGVAENGTIYVLSPATLAAGGVLNQPNLYAIAPGGGLRFVATLDPNDSLVIDSVHDAAAPQRSQFQTTPDGQFATFRSIATVTGVDNAGEPSVFLAESGEETICVSCNPSLTEDPTLKAPAQLAEDGLTITDDGRVFFTTTAALSIEDNNAKGDVYEWFGGRARLISAGSGRLDSELLTTTHNGIDTFFFTHDTLDAKVDQNGDLAKIYDARVGGGFFDVPPPKECKASDECHGPGTVAPAPAPIGSSGKNADGNVQKCPKGFVRHYSKDGKPGKCKKKHKKGKKHKRSKKKGAKRHG